ncbi:hypothetical protein [Tissierella praeacuta]|uniref:hypothetical protein n=1 Tax=Tissierella praeacuta TaxID=43131 RepID=UPI0028B1E359|nr:hypothetical protein [Tissierella praeacuta]
MLTREGLNERLEKIKGVFRENLVTVNFEYITTSFGYGKQDKKKEDYLARYFFRIPNINKKFMNIVNRYNKILEWNMLFSICTEIALKTIDSFEIYDKDVKYMKQDKDIAEKLTTAIVFAIDKQINNYIDDWTGAYRTRVGGTDVITSNLPPASFEYQAIKEELNEEYIKNKLELKAQELDQWGKLSIEGIRYLDTRDRETQRSMEFFFVKELTQNFQLEHIKNLIEENTTARQKEVWDALVQAEGNQEYASEILGCSQQNISKVQKNITNRIESKIENVYAKTRRDKIKILEKFIDSIEDEKEVIDFIKANMEEDFMYYLLYDSDVDADLVKCFNLNKDKEIHTDEMKRFCTYFLKEVYIYIEMLKYNDNIELKQLESSYPPRWYLGDKNSKVKRYFRWDKLDENQRIGDCIVIDGEKYYLIDKYKAKEDLFKTKIEYAKKVV